MTYDRHYPALLNDRLTPIYDLFARLFMSEMQFKRALIAYANLAAGQRVLYLGAGTGTQAIMVKQIQPDEQVTGLDGDSEILSIAREKASRSNVEIVFNVGNVIALPYADQSFERAQSTLVMSVLSSSEKRLAIREARRVLVRGCRTICDCLWHVLDPVGQNTQIADMYSRSEPRPVNLGRYQGLRVL